MTVYTTYLTYLATTPDGGRYLRVADASEARRVGDAIVAELAVAQANDWLDSANRVWTLLSRSYAQVRTTAFWLLRDEPQRQGDFPSLHATRRRRPSNAPVAVVPNSGEPV